jgi:hypothetical protein
LITKCEGCDLIAKQLLPCGAPCQYPLRLATRVLQVDARKQLPFGEAENERHELANGLGRLNTLPIHTIAGLLDTIRLQYITTKIVL